MRDFMHSYEQQVAAGVSTNSGTFTAPVAKTFDFAKMQAGGWLLTWAGSELAGLGWAIEAAVSSLTPVNSWTLVQSIAALNTSGGLSTGVFSNAGYTAIPWNVGRVRQINPVSNYAGTWSMMVYGKA